MSRIRLHKHLFTSLLLHSIISACLKWHLLKTTFNRSPEEREFQQASAASESASSSGSSICLVLSVLLRYFRSTNYLWMFNEALYLHQLIKHAFSQPSLRPLIILAYSLPFITTTSYIFARYTAPFSFSIEEAIESSRPVDYIAQPSPSSILMPELSVPPGASGEDFTSKGTFGQPVPSSSGVGTNAPDSDRVYHALTSLLRSSPTIREHLAFVQQDSLTPESEAIWWSDLLAGRANDAAVLLTPERLVAVDQEYEDTGDGSGSGGGVTHKSSSDIDNDESSQQVLDNLDALEDASPLIEEDNCWLMPSYESWHEWIINVPNLAILIVSQHIPQSVSIPRNMFQFQEK